MHFGSTSEFAGPSGEGPAECPGGYVNSRTKLVTAFAPFSEKRVKASIEVPLITVSVTVLSGFA
jgi:hypothetical protein